MSSSDVTSEVDLYHSDLFKMSWILKRDHLTQTRLPYIAGVKFDRDDIPDIAIKSIYITYTSSQVGINPPIIESFGTNFRLHSFFSSIPYTNGYGIVAIDFVTDVLADDIWGINYKGFNLYTFPTGTTGIDWKTDHFVADQTFKPGFRLNHNEGIIVDTAFPWLKYALIMQDDNNLVLYFVPKMKDNKPWKGLATWSTNTCGWKIDQGYGYANLQSDSDGNFVLYLEKGGVIWASGTSALPNSTALGFGTSTSYSNVFWVELQIRGIDSNGAYTKVIWSNGTGSKSP